MKNFFESSKRIPSDLLHHLKSLLVIWQVYVLEGSTYNIDWFIRFLRKEESLR